MIKKLMVTVIMCLMLISSLIPVSAFAADQGSVESLLKCRSCGGLMIFTEQSYTSIDSKTHKVISIWTCINGCEATRKISQTANHEWEQVNDNDKLWISNEEHKKYEYECPCGKKASLASEKHAMDNGVCSECIYPSRDRLMNDGQWIQFSGRPWLKIVVRENGYVKFSTTGTSGEYKLYNSEKKAIAKCNGSSSFRIDAGKTSNLVLKKGTYYIRKTSADLKNYSIEYTFKAVTEMKNYSKKTAVTLKKDTAKSFTVLPSYQASKCNASTTTIKKWFSIKVVAKSKICVYSNRAVCLSDSKGRSIKLEKVSYDQKNGVTKYVTQNKLAAGSYFLDSHQGWKTADRDKTFGSYNILKWTYK